MIVVFDTFLPVSCGQIGDDDNIENKRQFQRGTNAKKSAKEHGTQDKKFTF